MKIIETKIKDLRVIEPQVFSDNRGHFFESYNKNVFDSNGLCYDFIQDNQSLSSYGTVRGFHFQKGEYAQAKLVYVSYGCVLDVVVDLRKESSSFKEVFSIELSGENKKRFLIPRGFAHGFSVLSETAIFHYKCDNVWNRESESGIRFDDPDLNIDWQVDSSKMLVSEKDKLLPTLRNIELCF